MKTVLLLIVFYSFTAECYPKKSIATIDKNANIAFINMEAGGAKLNNPSSKPVTPVPQTIKPAVPTVKPVQLPTPQTQNQNTPAKGTDPIKSVAVPHSPAPITPVPGKTTAPLPPKPAQIQPKPVNPPPATNPITTPGPGSVKQLITFYDSQGKASPIRPYSYSQAVKQG